MTSPPVVDIVQFIEHQKAGGFILKLLGLSWIITFLDGMDSNLISFAAPHLVAEYHLSHVQTAQIFSVHQLGTLVGGLLWVFLGDIVGRRSTIIVSTLAFGLLTAGFQFANGFESLVALRFLDGIPLGGMLPLLWALNIEYVPNCYRATVVTLIMVGYPTGIAASGPLSIWLTPTFGWRQAFVIGGFAAVLGASLLYWKLPFSVSLSMMRRKRSHS